MWSTPLCFLFSILGASIAQYGIPYHSKFIFSPSEDSDPIVKTFLEKMTKTIETKDPKQISDLFDDDFSFHGCKGDYDKKKVVFILSQIPSATPFVITLKSSKFISDDKIEYSVTVSGIKSTPIEAKFILCSKHLNLEGGSIPSCQTHHFHGFVSQDNSDDVVQKFLDRMVRSIESKDVSIISGLFEPDFVLKGCKGVYDKKKIIALLEKLPTGTKFSFTLKSSQDTGSSIKYTVSITGFDKNEVIAEFILNKKDQQLESGSVPACQPKSLRGFFQNRPVIPVNRFFAEDTPVIRIESSRSFFDIQNRPIVQKFLDKIERAFTSKDSSVISDLFFPSFTFLSCGNHVFNRTETVHSLMSSDWHGVVTDAKDLESIVNLKISFNGLSKKQFVGEFLLDKAREQLAIGAGYNCDKGIKSRGFIAQDNAQATVEKFLVRMVNAVGSGEKSLVSGLFGEKFSFKGCKGTYTRDQAVAMLMFIPKGTNFGYKITSVEDLGSTIKCTTVATGLASSEVEFDFVLNKNDDKLESAEMPNCGSRRLSTYAENADDVINRFLGQLKETIASRDSTSIGKLFDDNFLFKGCKGTYTKNQVVSMIANSSPESSLEFTLQYSYYNQYGQIEYTVSVSGASPTPFDAQFVYCPYRNHLKSGKIPSCPAKRFTGFY